MANHNVNEAQFVTFMTEIDSQGQSLHFSHTGQILFLEIVNMISILLVTMRIVWSKMWMFSTSVLHILYCPSSTTGIFSPFCHHRV